MLIAADPRGPLDDVRLLRLGDLVLAPDHDLRHIFRRHDIGGGAKVLWSIFVIMLPFLGVFIYMITGCDSGASVDAQPCALSVAW
ncbi:MAG TPA: PLDc N-terminal domain-containing protein [Gaiellaceae bacterium]|nr:PLDc N-terminal domain-containing protein [Gaiellaceae bacterium]